MYGGQSPLPARWNMALILRTTPMFRPLNPHLLANLMLRNLSQQSRRKPLVVTASVLLKKGADEHRTVILSWTSCVRALRWLPSN